MTKYFIYCCLFLVLGTSEAQNNLFFSHYMFNPSYFNPGWVGSENIASVSFLYRNQWTGYQTSFDGNGGAPNTQMLSLMVPVKGAPIQGIGLNVSNDNLGPDNNLQIQLSGSYEFKLRFSILQIGIMPGLYTKTINGSQLDPNDRTDPNLLPLFGKTESQTKANLGLGILLKSNNGYYLGLSTLNVIQPGFDFGLNGTNNIQKRTYYASGGTAIKVNSNITLRPSAIVRTDLSGVSFDLGSILNYGDKLWTGLAYRLEESMILYLGYHLLENKLMAGYSFDYVIHNQNAKQPTSHEIYLKYNLPDFVLGGKKSVKTPRFTF